MLAVSTNYLEELIHDVNFKKSTFYLDIYTPQN